MPYIFAQIWGIFMDHFELNYALSALLEQIDRVKSHFIENIPESCIHLARWPSLSSNNDCKGQEMLKTALTDIEIHDGDDGRTTRPYPGVVEVDKEALEAFCELNASKDELKIILKRLKSEAPKDYRRYIDFLKNGASSREERYPISFGRLSINHLERKFGILLERPISVSYSWSSRSKSIVQLTKSMAIKALQDLNEESPDHLRLQIEQIAGLKDTEMLARVIPSSAGMKANIVFKNGDSKTIKPGLPIIVPAGESRIRIKLLSESDISVKSSRLERADKQLEDNPIAPSIHVFRYRESKRVA